MENKTNKEALENEISRVRAELMIKGTDLYFKKQDFKQAEFDSIETLAATVKQLRIELNTLTIELEKLKSAYFVSYEVTYLNNWNSQINKEIFHERLLLDKNVNVDLPNGNDWMLANNQVNELLLDILAMLKNRYDEVILLRVKKI